MHLSPGMTYWSAIQLELVVEHTGVGMVVTGTPERLGVLTGGEANAERSFASSAQMYSVKFVAPGSLQVRVNVAVPISET